MGAERMGVEVGVGSRQQLLIVGDHQPLWAQNIYSENLRSLRQCAHSITLEELDKGSIVAMQFDGSCCR